MIKKSWLIESKYYDSLFDVAVNNAWKVWQEEIQYYNVLDAPEWLKRFNCKPVLNENSKTWNAMIFKNKADYVLFMMEWS
jgi:hypothetical protein